jgi:hypothetical protein
VPIGEYWAFTFASDYVDGREGLLAIEDNLTDLEFVMMVRPETDDSKCYPAGDTVPVEGTFTDSETGEPIEGATILLFVCEEYVEAENAPDDATVTGYMTPVHPVTAAMSDEEGKFTLHVMPIADGDYGYRFYVSAEGYAFDQGNRFVKWEGDDLVIETNTAGMTFGSDFDFELEPLGAED